MPNHHCALLPITASAQRLLQAHARSLLLVLVDDDDASWISAASKGDGVALAPAKWTGDLVTQRPRSFADRIIGTPQKPAGGAFSHHEPTILAVRAIAKASPAAADQRLRIYATPDRNTAEAIAARWACFPTQVSMLARKVHASFRRCLAQHPPATGSATVVHNAGTVDFDGFVLWIGNKFPYEGR